MSKILFLTTSHRYDDDRIFHHQAKELLKQGNEVKICSLCADFRGDLAGIEIESYSILEKSSEEKVAAFQKVINSFQPDCLICSEPLAIIAAKKYSKSEKVSLIYDITEWYPSMRMVANFKFPLNIIHAVKFFLIQVYAGFLSTHFIFGEKTKKFPLAYFFPFKKKLFLPYFPNEEYIHENIKTLATNEIKLCYTGQFSEEKGIGNFFEAVSKVKEKNPDLKVSILLIGGTRKDKDQIFFENLLEKYRFENLEIRKSTSFERFTETYSDADICFDLREVNFENHHCSPIKIYYYAGSGKPVIYTDLKATRNDVDTSKFGYLVNPKDSGLISDLILKYIENPDLYRQHATNARQLFEQKYNWKLISKSFVDFVNFALK
ncbi:glycosyltransferase [Chryseobacterium koreense]|uniref:Glycosyl transferase family 1 n=1 Tax=Chryseobacterium koreense CCUG 49689 TaxID=1304281 RepID=A0A0J7J0J8_9FLAO|nr:glycosyltransferase [Chryseobacterium koreense]KMQ71978.1 glycosyl transferase family 1 [Chryseobacterium koreense CCUG 49689]MBB5332155.1 glycosyltransferase involved in cell wall biosynthesis [Chryseobacterium koreense]